MSYWNVYGPFFDRVLYVIGTNNYTKSCDVGKEDDGPVQSFERLEIENSPCKVKCLTYD